MRNVSSAFWAKLQLDGGQITELIDLTGVGFAYHWTTNNQEVTASWCGAPTKYDPFPGMTSDGVQESSDLAISVIDFIMVNTGNILSQLLIAGEFSRADVVVDRAFIDTPGLGRMNIYTGKVGDYTHDRMAVAGQARNMFQSLAVQWPYYGYQDQCAWRFGSVGCGVNPGSYQLNVGTADILTAFTTTSYFVMNTGFLANSFPDGRFLFGRVTVTGGSNSGQIRTVRGHAGDVLTLSHPLPIDSLDFIQFTLWPGCRKRLVDDCHSLYNNTENFLGFPWIPIQEQVW